MITTGFSYIEDNDVIIVSTTGFASTIDTNIRVNILDKNSVLYPNVTVEIRKQSDDSLVDSYFTNNGIASFEVENGDYYITTNNSARKQNFTYAGVNLIENFMVYDKTHVYRVKAIRDGTESDYSNELTKIL